MILKPLPCLQSTPSQLRYYTPPIRMFFVVFFYIFTDHAALETQTVPLQCLCLTPNVVKSFRKSFSPIASIIPSPTTNSTLFVPLSVGACVSKKTSYIKLDM